MAARARARVTRTKAPLELPRMSWGEVALVTLAILALIYVCWVARTVLIPIAIAFTLQGLFSPIVRSLARRGVPRSVGALGVLLFLTALDMLFV